MSAITIFMGRPTSDPIIQQGKNGGAEYVSLDLAVTQRGQNNENETIFYQCYFNSFLAQRLINAGVKKGTCLQITGTQEVHPFVYTKGQKSGQAGVSVNIRVLDWQFAIANKSESQGAAPAGGNVPPQGNPAPVGGGPATPGGGGYQNTGIPGGAQQNAGGAPNIGNYAMQNGYAANNMSQGAAAGTNPQMGGAPYGMMPGAGDGFANIPESMAGQLPFPN